MYAMALYELYVCVYVPMQVYTYVHMSGPLEPRKEPQVTADYLSTSHDGQSGVLTSPDAYLVLWSLYRV